MQGQLWQALAHSIGKELCNYWASYQRGQCKFISLRLFSTIYLNCHGNRHLSWSTNYDTVIKLCVHFHSNILLPYLHCNHDLQLAKGGQKHFWVAKNDCIVSVLHQDEGGIGKSIPDGRKISRDPRDFPRAKPEGNLEGRGKSERVEGCKTHGRGKSRGRRGWISQYLPSLGGARTFSHHYQGRIDWQLHTLLKCSYLAL